jgi:histidyl-tRNA synthetase
MKAQLRLANTQGCAYAVIIGEAELEKGVVALRDMRTASQEEITPEALVERLG